MTKPILKRIKITSKEIFNDVEYDCTRDGVKITWPNGTVTEETIYEMYGFVYSPEFDLVIIHGHEEILLVKEDGTKFKTYSR